MLTLVNKQKKYIENSVQIKMVSGLKKINNNKKSVCEKYENCIL